MKKIVLVIVALMLASSIASGQSIFERLRNKGREVIENAVTGNNEEEQTEEEQPEEEVHEHAAQGWTCPECGHAGNTGKFCEECGAKKPGEGAAAPAKKQVQMGYAKTDFVPGDEIFFEDTFEQEQLGEFP